MKLFKGILLYTLIALGAVIVIALILLGLMFVAKVKIFGIGFVYRTDHIAKYPMMKLEEYDTNGTCGDIDLNIKTTKGVGVKLEAAVDDTQAFIYAETLENYYGFYKDSNSTTLSAYSIVKDGTKLIVDITVTGLNGAINYSDKCYLTVNVPRYILGQKDNGTYKYNVNITSENGDVNVTGAVSENKFVAPIIVNDLNVNTIKGDFTISGATNNLANCAKEGSVYKKPEKIYLQKLTLKTEAGRFNFADIKNVYVGQSTLLQCTKGDFVFDTLGVGTDVSGTVVDTTAVLDIFGQNILFEANNLTVGNKLTYKTASGIFKIKETMKSESDQIELETDSAEVYINKVLNGSIGVRSAYGNITIKEVNDSTYVENNHGNINIGTCTQGIAAISTYGDINIDKCTASALVSSQRGSIKVNNESTSTDDKVIVNAKKTSINLTIGVAPFEINTTDNCTINVTVKKVVEAKTVSGEPKNVVSKINGKGTINISIPNVEQFTLTANGALSGSVGSYNANSDIKNGQKVVLFRKNNDDTIKWENSEFQLTATKIHFSTTAA